MKKRRIAVGLSGGIDSSVSTYLLKKSGWEVVGFTLKFYPEENRCCDLDSLNQAKQLCYSLDVPHYTLDVSELFRRKIVDYFMESYLKGQTPNPCVYCNRFIKFGIFLDKVKALDIDYLATGHYLRLAKAKGKYFLREAKDKKKSQEYFLSLVKPEVLNSLVFPLGNYKKTQVKKIAKDKKLNFVPRKESQDVCFIGNKFYYQFIRDNIPNSESYCGDIRHLNGDILGKHRGIYHYTYGQRAGLGVAHKHPLYVAAIDSQSKTVIVADKAKIYRDEFVVRCLNWFADPGKRKIKVKVRYNSKKVTCRLDLKESLVKVKLSDKIEAITPGQIAVFYDRDRVLGAGTIAET